jgi:hypothetical protein
MHDFRFALRQLRKAPAFTATAIATLALGFAASVAIFAFVDSALLAPLPYRDSTRLVGVYESVQMFPQSNLSYLDYLDWKRTNRVLSALSAYQNSGVSVSTLAGAQRATGARISDDFFRTLGVTPVLGRDFAPGEDLADAPRTTILSHAAWLARYGGRPDAVGRKVTLNGLPHDIVGVLPAGFHFAPVGDAEFWITLHPSGGCDLRRSCHNLYGVGRLADGVTAATADAAMKGIAKELEQQYPDSNRGQGAVVVPLTDVLVGSIRPTLLLLLVAVSAAIGLALSHWVAELLTALVPANLATRMPFLQQVGVNARVAVFALAIAAVAAAIFAATPLVHLALSKGAGGLSEGRGAAGLAWRRMGSSLVVVELALAVVLLAGAGLLGKSVYRLLDVDLGMRAEGLTILGVSAPAATYDTDEKLAALATRVLARVSSLPGVESAGLASVPPIFGGNTMWIRVIGRPYNGEHNEVLFREVTPGYLGTLGARLVRGRHLSDGDNAAGRRVVIVNEALVRKYFPNEEPLGQQLVWASGEAKPLEIVGIVSDIKEGAIDAATEPALYVPFAQDPTRGVALVVRTAQEDQAILPTLSAAMRDIDPDISTFAGRTMTEIINESQSAYLRRSSAALVGAFAAMAWLLGVIGLYGVVAYSVSRRTREIGVRVALGAQRAAVFRLILGEAGRLTLAGLAAGLVAAAGATTLLRSLLFGVSAWDPATLAVVAGVLGVSALAASFVPARRAASVSPNDALRVD